MINSRDQRAERSKLNLSKGLKLCSLRILQFPKQTGDL
nr:MAG TPA: hypothetical protein [Caudoviricetes sp.]